MHKSSGTFLAVIVATILTLPLFAASAATPTTPRSSFLRLSDSTAFATGTSLGANTSGNTIRISNTVGTRRVAGRTWRYAQWSSGWVQPVAPSWTFDQVIPSWSASTPKNTFVEVQLRARSTTGAVSGWKVMGRWASGEWLRRSSSTSQADGVATVATDTLVAAPGVRLNGYQIQLVLNTRRRKSPVVRMIGAVASSTGAVATSTSAGTNAVLPVPTYSQMNHRGHYRQYGGGGEAWCSPTSLSMILGYYGRLPRPAEYRWVKRRYPDPFVASVARSVYDVGYRGAGNWSFNTAFASTRGLDAFVTRLGDLRDAERFIAAGIPLAASISFDAGQLSGAPISSTAGHLVVIVGFTATGDVVVNDPAATSNSTVRRTYNRAQFESSWQKKSGGAVYVVHDAAHPLPARTATSAW